MGDIVKNRFVRLLIPAAAGIYFVLAVADITVDPAKFQWDFTMYYATAKAHLAGLDPYDQAAVSSMAGRDVFEFFYFPTSIAIFIPFTSLPYDRAALLFLGIKTLLVILLIILWQREFLDDPGDSLFSLFCLLAFNCPLYLDLQAGNVSVVEQILLWTGFWCFLRGWVVPFAVLVVLAGIFKITPLFFAVLALFLHGRDRILGVATAGIVACGIGLIAWLMDPVLFGRFFSHALTITEVPWDFGLLNPSSLSMIKDFFRQVTMSFGVPVPGVVAVLLFLGWVAFVAYSSGKTAKSLDLSTREGRLLLVSLACLAYALMVPRFKDYSSAILLVPTYLLLTRSDAIPARPLLLVLIAVSAANVSLPFLDGFLPAALGYYPLLLGFVVWWLYRDLIAEAVARNKPADASPVDPAPAVAVTNPSG
jgi:hypothetical protein